MKYMLLIYMGENAMTEGERAACYEESTQLCHDLQSRDQFISANPLQPISTAGVKTGLPLCETVTVTRLVGRNSGASVRWAMDVIKLSGLTLSTLMACVQVE